MLYIIISKTKLNKSYIIYALKGYDIYMKDKIDNIVFKCFMILFLFYYSYRYILQMNSDRTSPTYSNTPLAIQIFKYVIVFILILCLFLNNFQKKIIKKNNFFIFCLAYETVYSLYSFFLTKKVNILFFGSMSGIIIMVYLLNLKIKFIDFNKYICFYIFFTIIYEFIQIFLYIYQGRLPALGYATGNLSDVRFGGPWDDPNGFSILLSFLIPFSCCYFKKLKKYVIVSILILFLVLTWSLTGIFTFIMVLLFYGYGEFKKKGRKTKKKILNIFILSCIVIGIITFFLIDTDRLVLFITKKLESINIHLQAFKFQDLTILNFLGIKPNYVGVESGYIELVYTFGIVGCLSFIYISIYSIRNIKKKIKYNSNAIYIAMYCYMIAFLIANINLPLQFSFSNYGVFILCVCAGIQNYNEVIENESLFCY